MPDSYCLIERQGVIHSPDIPEASDYLLKLFNGGTVLLLDDQSDYPSQPTGLFEKEDHYDLEQWFFSGCEQSGDYGVKDELVNGGGKRAKSEHQRDSQEAGDSHKKGNLKEYPLRSRGKKVLGAPSGQDGGDDEQQIQHTKNKFCQACGNGVCVFKPDDMSCLAIQKGLIGVKSRIHYDNARQARIKLVDEKKKQAEENRALDRAFATLADTVGMSYRADCQYDILDSAMNYIQNMKLILLYHDKDKTTSESVSESDESVVQNSGDQEALFQGESLPQYRFRVLLKPRVNKPAIHSEITSEAPPEVDECLGEEVTDEAAGAQQATIECSGKAPLHLDSGLGTELLSDIDFGSLGMLSNPGLEGYSEMPETSNTEHEKEGDFSDEDRQPVQTLFSCKRKRADSQDSGRDSLPPTPE